MPPRTLVAVLSRLRIDYFMLAIIATAIFAAFVPARGGFAEALDVVTSIMIAVLFFLYGARLHPQEALKGLTHWRLHLVILAFTFIVFPLVGLALTRLPSNLIGPDLALGVLYLTLVPSTVQSSINFTSVARGNVPGALVSATASNLLGVLLTPVMVLLLMNSGGQSRVQASSLIDIVIQILVPFIVGQLSRRWTATPVQRHKKGLKLVDQSVIVLVVYSAFSTGMREGIWQLVTARNLIALVVLLTVVLVAMLALTWWLAKALKFSIEDAIAIQMCGTKKSLASGLPMATVLFAAGPVPAGLMVLPLMVFHQLQLMVCGYLAGRYARRPEPAQD